MTIFRHISLGYVSLFLSLLLLNNALALASELDFFSFNENEYYRLEYSNYPLKLNINTFKAIDISIKDYCEAASSLSELDKKTGYSSKTKPGDCKNEIEIFFDERFGDYLIILLPTKKSSLNGATYRIEKESIKIVDKHLWL